MQKIDCFIRSSRNLTNLRNAMYNVCAIRWEMEPVRVHVLRDKGITEARRLAEDFAQSDPYIVTDNDVLIVGKRWVERGREVLLAHPEYAVASTLSLVEGENGAKGDGDIYPMHAVGAPMWIRKGILTDLPEMDINGECGAIDQLVLEKGLKEGLISGIRHNHLGHGFSMSNDGLCFGY